MCHCDRWLSDILEQWYIDNIIGFLLTHWHEHIMAKGHSDIIASLHNDLMTKHFKVDGTVSQRCI